MTALSADSIAALIEGGLTYADIGRAVGRDKSLIRQIGTGRKPGENLRGALAELTERLATNGPMAARQPATAPVARRTTRTGREARVRRPVTVSGAGWQTSTLRRQASQGGGGGMVGPLRQAAAQGRQVAVTATMAGDTYVTGGSGKRTVEGYGGTVEMSLGDAADILDALDSGMTFAEYVVGEMHAAGYVAPDASVDQIEMRAW